MKRWMLFSLLLVTFSFLFMGCATIMHGTHQEIEIASSPTGARVLVDDTEMGTTPMSVIVARSSDHRLRVELEGYGKAEWSLSRKVSGWVWGNLVLAPLLLPLPIQWFTETLSGGCYMFEPDQLYVQLRKEVGGTK